MTQASNVNLSVEAKRFIDATITDRAIVGSIRDRLVQVKENVEDLTERLRQAKILKAKERLQVLYLS
ncbi:hypothetical protein [Myxosarcina sp. GI1(2024)]